VAAVLPRWPVALLGPEEPVVEETQIHLGLEHPEHQTLVVVLVVQEVQPQVHPAAPAS
jgi:hypothetical protein